MAERTFTLTGEHHFGRGDANGDGNVDIGDAITLFGYLFNGMSIPSLDAADANDDGVVTIADPITILNYLHGQGSLPAPFPAPGPDPTPDDLGNDP